MKRIVICCDGTWQKPDQPAPTNVTKLALAVASRDPADVLQQVYYDPGVGASPWEHFRGGAFGVGLSRNIQRAYRYLINTYELGDELFLFGFSRGAYTVRSLAGFIRNSGLLRREHADQIDAAYTLYRRRDNASKPTANEAQLFRHSYTYASLGPDIRIKCLGVWDTVGALGIPVGVFAQLSRVVLHLQFHDVLLSSYVDNAFQALALDEQRQPYEPAVWQQQKHAAGQRLEQRWFPGLHSNIGGGYSDTGLSDIAFLWMKECAESCGLAFDLSLIPDKIKIKPDVTGYLPDSREGIYRLIWNRRRPVPGGCAESHEDIHPSIDERIQAKADYRPKNLPADRSLVRRGRTCPDDASS